MDTAHTPPPYVSPSAPTTSTPHRLEPPRPVAPDLNVMSLVVAVAVFLGSLGLGLWLIVAAPDDARTSTAELTSQAEYGVYGGDAYTGIQNAAADTEGAVVSSANLLSQLASDQAEADNERWAHLWVGAGILIVLLGAANLGATIQRSARG